MLKPFFPNVNHLRTAKVVGDEPVLNDLVGSCGIIVKVDTVTSIWLDISLESTGIGIGRLDVVWDRGHYSAGCRTIATTINIIVVASDNLDGTGEWGRLWCTICERKDLSQSHGLLGLLREDGGTNVKVSGEEEGEDVGSQISPGEISCREILGNDGVVPAIDDVANLGACNLLVDLVVGKVDTNVGEGRIDEFDKRGRKVFAKHALNTALNGLVSEAEGLVQASKMKVPVSESLTNPGTVHGETSENDTIGCVGIHGRQDVRLGRAKGVADVNDLVEFGRHLREGAVSEHHGEFEQSGDLGWGLDEVQWIPVRAVADAKSVNGYSVEALEEQWFRTNGRGREADVLELTHLS